MPTVAGRLRARNARAHTRGRRVQFVYGIYIRNDGVLARMLRPAAEQSRLTVRQMDRAARKFAVAMPREPGAAAGDRLATGKKRSDIEKERLTPRKSWSTGARERVAAVKRSPAREKRLSTGRRDRRATGRERSDSSNRYRQRHDRYQPCAG